MNANGNNSEIGKIIDFVRKGSLNQKLGETERNLGQARIENNLTRVKELERERAEILAEMNPVIYTEVPYPAPISKQAFHGLAGEIVNEIEPHTEADSVALLMNFHTCFGNVIGRSAYYRVGVSKHYMKLDIGLVGKTAKGRKGMSWDPIVYIFELVEPDWVKDRINTGLSTGEGLISHIRDEVYKDIKNQDTRLKESVLTDFGVDDKRLLMVEPELAQTLKVLSRETNTLSPILRSAWDSGKLQTMTKLSPLKSTGSHVSIIGHISKKELVQGLKDIEKGNGFANRFLWFCVDRSQSLPFGGRFDLINFDYLTDRLKEAIAFAKRTEEVTWAEETRDQWAEIYPILSEGKEGMVGSITARAEAQTVRLASIYALLDLSNEIKPAHLAAALAVWEYSEASVRHIFQQSITEPLIEEIYHRLIDNPQGLGRAEINNLLGRHEKSENIEDALEVLKANGLADSSRTKTKGRDKEIWKAINPEMIETQEVNRE